MMNATREESRFDVPWFQPVDRIDPGAGSGGQSMMVGCGWNMRTSRGKTFEISQMMMDNLSIILSDRKWMKRCEEKVGSV
jgi:hypothetical protein